MAEPVGQKDVTSNCQKQPNISVRPTNAGKRKRTSPVWKDFEEILENGKTVAARCKHCQSVLSAVSIAGTSSLLNHIKKVYKVIQENQEAQQKGQTTLQVNQKRGEGGPSLNFQNFKFNPLVTREAITEMILLHEYPFSMVEHIGFRTVLKSMQPTFKFYKRNTARSDCMKRYITEKKALYEKLGKLQSRISFTSDFWSSNQNKSYMSLTAHYVDDNWKLQKKILCFSNVKGRHTGENIGNVVLEKLYEWNLDRKIATITLDNASSNDGVVRQIYNKLQPKGTLILNGQLLQVRCCAHILNLIVQDGLKEIEGELEKVRATVRFIRNSPQRQEKFEGACEQLGVPSKKFVQDVCTRWNSTYKMLKVVIELNDALTRYAEKDPEFKCGPSEVDWENGVLVADCLKVSKYTTVNRYFELSCNIYLQLLEWCTCEDEFIVSMAKKMKEKFVKYWNITNVVFSVSSIFDPRIKMQSVSYYYPKIYGIDCDEKIAHVRGVLTSLYDEYTIQSSTPSQSYQWNTSSSSKPAGQPSTCDDSEGTSKNTFASKLRGFETYLEESSKNVFVKNDLDLYLDEPAHPVEKGKGLDDQNFNVLSWWQYNAPKYPTLGKIARDILGIPASSVASESAFSTGGRVVNRYRSTMHANTIEALICTQDWIRKAIEGGGVHKEEGGLEAIDKAIADFEEDEDCGDILQPKDTNKSAPILDVWELDEDE